MVRVALKTIIPRNICIYTTVQSHLHIYKILMNIYTYYIYAVVEYMAP